MELLLKSFSLQENNKETFGTEDCLLEYINIDRQVIDNFLSKLNLLETQKVDIVSSWEILEGKLKE